MCRLPNQIPVLQSPRLQALGKSEAGSKSEGGHRALVREGEETSVGLSRGKTSVESCEAF